MPVEELLNKIEDVRESQCLTRKELCAKAGIQYVTYMHWLEGKRTPNCPILCDVAKALGYKLTIVRNA